MTAETLQTIAAFAGHLGLLSLVSVGGAHTVLPDLYRYAVLEHGWLTGAEFSALVAVGQTAPGPNVMVMTLLGYAIAGPLCALAATLAFCVPPILLTYAVVRFGRRSAAAPWRRWLRQGFAPLTVGLVVASGVILANNAGGGGIGLAITLSTAVMVAFTRVHPLWFILASALIGLAM